MRMLDAKLDFHAKAHVIICIMAKSKKKKKDRKENEKLHHRKRFASSK